MKRALRSVLWAAFLVLLVATGLHFAPQLQAGLSTSTRIGQGLARLDATKAQLLEEQGGWRAALEQRLATARGATVDELASRRAAVQAEREAALAARRPALARTAAFLTGEGLREDLARDVRIEAADIELRYLDALIGRLAPAARHAERLRTLQAAELSAWQRLSSGHRVICPVGEVPWYDLTFTRQHIADCRAYAEARRAVAEERARAAPIGSLPDVPSTAALARDALASIDAASADLRRELGESAIARHVSGIRSRLPTAVAWLAGAIAVSLGVIVGVRALFYFVIAPWVSRRRPVLLLPDSRSPALPAAGGRISAVSQAVVVAPEEELLVHSRFLQSADMSAQMRTRWLLSWRFPISSIAAHLVALTRIRTDAPRTFVVSATGHDAVSEIGCVRLEAGEALVLQPRCLVGVLQRRDSPMRITRHWRLTSLNAWLTLQLRFLVFHGPATLFVKGARGVRLEAADAGRAIDQAATLGFGANVAYSQVRTETFFPYLSGRHALFNDRFSAASGVCLYEETTAAGRGARGVAGRQLEGLIDALLKIFGV